MSRDVIDRLAELRHKPRNAEIVRIARVLAGAWNQFPQLRLGQLLVNALHQELEVEGRDLFYVEDGEVERRLREYFQANRRDPTKVSRGRRRSD